MCFGCDTHACNVFLGCDALLLCVFFCVSPGFVPNMAHHFFSSFCLPCHRLFFACATLRQVFLSETEIHSRKRLLGMRSAGEESNYMSMGGPRESQYLHLPLPACLQVRPGDNLAAKVLGMALRARVPSRVIGRYGVVQDHNTLFI